YASISFMRRDPIISMGIASMVIQGLAFSWMISRMPRRAIGDAVRFALVAGSVIVSYIALGEAGKYAVPSVARWIGQEVGAGLVQFALYGVLLGLVYRTAPARS